MSKVYRQDAGYTEDSVSLAIEAFLTIFSFPRLRFSVEPFSRHKERFLGADARLRGDVVGFRPFYMQFKRPSSYSDLSNSRIVKDRKNLQLNTQPSSLFFELRRKTKQQKEFQHNILFKLRRRLRKRGIGDAAYVCPLFLDRSAYRFHIQIAGLSRWPRFWRYDPWELEDVLINSGGGSVRFDRIPVLAEHLSIPPHALVSDASHSYSFSEMGKEVCFHSPESLPDGARKLSDFLKSISEGLLKDGGSIDPQNANDELKSIFLADDDDNFPIPPVMTEDGDPFSSWLSWGQFLRDEYDIEQYAMFLWSERG